MQGADYVIVAVVGVSVVLGLVRGFIREAVALASWLLGVWLAWHHSSFLYPWLGGTLDSPEQKAWVARGIVLLLTLLAGAGIGALLAWVTRTAAGLGAVDRLLGLLFGFTRGAIVVGFGVMLGHVLQFDREPWWQRATLMPYAEYVGGWVEGYAGGTREIARRVLDAAREEVS